MEIYENYFTSTDYTINNTRYVFKVNTKALCKTI